jgi:hypothetical protein
MKSASDTLQKVRSSIEYTEREIKDKELELSRTSTPVIRYCCVHLTSLFYLVVFQDRRRPSKMLCPLRRRLSRRSFKLQRTKSSIALRE